MLTEEIEWSAKLSEISQKRPALAEKINSETHEGHNLSFVHRKNRNVRHSQYWPICLDCRALLKGPVKRSAVPDLIELELQSFAKVAAFLAPAMEYRLEQYASFKEEWWRTYNDYLKSAKWRTMRSLVMERDNGTCRRCSSQAEHVHHLNYDRVGDESMSDLVAVCSGCHKWIHSRRDNQWNPTEG